VGGVLIGAAHRVLGLRLRMLDDLLRLYLGLPQDRLVLQEQRRLFLRGADDLLRLLASLREHPLGLLIDPPRLADLLGDRDAELIDEVEDRGLLEDDLARHRHLARVHRERFEPLDEELDVQRQPPPPGSSYLRKSSASSPNSFVLATRAPSGRVGWCFLRTRATASPSGASAPAAGRSARTDSRIATSANGGSQNTRSYGDASRCSRETSTFAGTMSLRPSKPVVFRFWRSAASACEDRSTNVACAAPRESASMPSVPAPANRSRTRAPGSEGSRMAKSVSRMRSVAERVPPPRGTTSGRPFAVPAMTLITRRRSGARARRPPPRAPRAPDARAAGLARGARGPRQRGRRSAAPTRRSAACRGTPPRRGSRGRAGRARSRSAAHPSSRSARSSPAGARTPRPSRSRGWPRPSDRGVRRARGAGGAARGRSARRPARP